jgi:Uma2 family endonuclease
VPDRAYFRSATPGLHLPAAELVVEVLSPGEQPLAKFGFYAEHGVREIIVADPDSGTVAVYCGQTHSGQMQGAKDRRPSEAEPYVRTDRSDLLGLTAADLVAAVDWP